MLGFDAKTSACDVFVFPSQERHSYDKPRRGDCPTVALEPPVPATTGRRELSRGESSPRVARYDPLRSHTGSATKSLGTRGAQSQRQWSSPTATDIDAGIASLARERVDAVLLFGDTFEQPTTYELSINLRTAKARLHYPAVAPGMDRRRFLLTSLAGALAAPLAPTNARAQVFQRVDRIGILSPGPAPGRSSARGHTWKSAVWLRGARTGRGDCL